MTIEGATDWIPVRVEDAMSYSLGGMSPCDRCSTPLRWVHVLTNGCGVFARVGCCCAIRMTSGAYDAKGAEREVVNRGVRLLRFISSKKWKVSRNNPENVSRPVILPGGTARVTVFSKHGRYGVFVAMPKGNNVTPFERFDNRAAAKAFAFELIESLTADPECRWGRSDC